MATPDLRDPAERARLREICKGASPVSEKTEYLDCWDIDFHNAAMEAFPAALDLIEEQVGWRQTPMAEIIEELLADGGKLGIFTDKRDSQSVVVVWAQGDGPESRFYGDTLLDCLRQAAKAKKGAAKHGDT